MKMNDGKTCVHYGVADSNDLLSLFKALGLCIDMSMFCCPPGLLVGGTVMAVFCSPTGLGTA